MKQKTREDVYRAANLLDNELRRLTPTVTEIQEAHDTDQGFIGAQRRWQLTSRMESVLKELEPRVTALAKELAKVTLEEFFEKYDSFEACGKIHTFFTTVCRKYFNHDSTVYLEIYHTLGRHNRPLHDSEEIKELTDKMTEEFEALAKLPVPVAYFRTEILSCAVLLLKRYSLPTATVGTEQRNLYNQFVERFSNILLEHIQPASTLIELVANT